jgi:hypothetical protein
MQVRGERVEMNWFKSLWGGAASLGRSDNETIQQRIRRHVERRGGTPAVWFAPDQFCSYSQINENAAVISQAFHGCTIGTASVADRLRHTKPHAALRQLLLRNPV